MASRQNSFILLSEFVFWKTSKNLHCQWKSLLLKQLTKIRTKSGEDGQKFVSTNMIKILTISSDNGLKTGKNDVRKRYKRTDTSLDKFSIGWTEILTNCVKTKRLKSHCIVCIYLYLFDSPTPYTFEIDDKE